MKVPLSWLKDYVDIKVSAEEFARAMTMSGSKVEGIETKGKDISGVVAGRILSLEKHPNADRLQMSRVDVGNGVVVRIVTGARNVKEGDVVPIALDGAMLAGGKTIRKTLFRGVESEGMMCSIQELGLDTEDYPDAAGDGIFILNGLNGSESGIGGILGKDIKEVLELGETVLEFEITSNRPDCLSMVGIAREAAATLGGKLEKPLINLREEGGDASDCASVEIKDAFLCPRYAARIIKDVKIGPSPKWMRDRLSAAGIRPINNIVDITNYVMLELGQPMHAFDLEKLEGRKIIVRRAVEGEIMMTLDGQERTLDESTLVIADAAKPVAVAGVMGGADSEITERTRAILFESANFNGMSVRHTAKKLGMRTEASSRFEKGLDPENVETAINRAAQLVEEIGAGVVCRGMIDCYPLKPVQNVIKLRPDRINALLGASVGKDYMIGILRSLEFEVDEESMEVKVPGFRQDVEREADLAEEIARIYGYNRIEATLLEGKAATQGKKSKEQKLEEIIKNTMLSCGLSETYTYSFTSPKAFDRLRLPADSPLRRAVAISNPLGEDYGIMRTTTIPDMLDVIARNFNRQVEEARLFELSHVYIPKSLPVTELPEEKKVLALGLYGSVDFYDLKGVVEELLDALGIRGCEFVPLKDDPSFHPGRAARIMLKGNGIGIIGQIHPKVAEEFECPETTYAGIIDVAPLMENASLTVEYRPLPKYPAVLRDIAVIVEDGVPVKQIEDIIKRSAGEILESLKLFDVYKGRQVTDGMKSVAYSIAFRAGDRTLTDEEVNKAMDRMLRELKDELGAQLRA